MEDRKYTILVQDSVKNLVIEVNKSIQTGWVPLGAPFTVKENNTTKWLQAIIKQG